MKAGKLTAVLLLGVALAVLLGTGSAAAAQRATHTFLSSFDGTGSTGGPFGTSVSSVAVDEETDSVYVASSKEEGFLLYKFNANGSPSAFAALGAATTIPLDGKTYGRRVVEVDNSHTSTRGRIYAAWPYGIYAFDRSGNPVGGNFPLNGFLLSDLAVDPVTGNFWVVRNSAEPHNVVEYTSDGVPTGRTLTFLEADGGQPTNAAVDGDQNIYVRRGFFEAGTDKYDSDLKFMHRIPTGGGLDVDLTTNDLLIAQSGDTVTQWSPSGSRLLRFGQPGLASSIAINSPDGKVYVGNGSNTGDGDKVSIYATGPTVTLPDVSTGVASNFQMTSVALAGIVDPDGEATTACKFEWSIDTSFSQSTPCAEGEVLTGSSSQQVSATASGLIQGQSYNWRLTATNPNGKVLGLGGTFVPSTAPTTGSQWADDVRSDGAVLNADVGPGGASTTYRFEYGLEDCEVVVCDSTPSEQGGSGLLNETESTFLAGLDPGKTYHYRVVASNQSGTTTGADRTFTTFPFTEVLNDPCSNAHVRQQTGAALLPDCRAYELVSAGDTGGYDVESDLVPDRQPFSGYPNAEGRVLYGIHNGAIPGSWNPTNRGVDPYVATRGSDGWKTSYVGLPADNLNAIAPFSSSLLEASSGLDVFAFGGDGICSPCFADGSTGIPMRNSSGDIEQAMAGSISQPGASQVGDIRKRLSADGTHLLFASISQFESDGNSNGADATVYARNLKTKVTETVSTLPSGEVITNGDGIAALDISEDGSRVVIGEEISIGPGDVPLYHLYMHVAGLPSSLDLTPGATIGARFDGMTSDGGRVFVTTRDPLISPDDSDTSADIYEVAVGVGSVDPGLLTTDADGLPVNDDSCNPPGSPDAWNVTGGPGKCDALAFAGGAGLAASDGTFYFLSPEQLDMSGAPTHQPTADLPNLYVVRSGEAPRFVATIDTDAGKPGDPPPTHELLSANFTGLTGFSNKVEAMTVDGATGDVYMVNPFKDKLSRFTAAGSPKNFAARPGVEGNMMNVGWENPNAGSVAIDRSGGPGDGRIYVSDTAAEAVKIYANDGTPIGELDGSENPNGSFSYVTGVSVNQTNGDVYVSDLFTETVWRYSPAGATPVAETGYSGGMAVPWPGSTAADGTNFYAGEAFAEFFPGTIRKYSTTDFTAVPGSPSFTTLIPSGGTGLSVDPRNGDLYVSFSSKVSHFDAAGNLIDDFGVGSIAESSGVAVSTASGPSLGHVYVSNEDHVTEFGEHTDPPYIPIDHPAVVNARVQPQTHTYGDFQVTPDGGFAAFTSALSLTGADSDGLFEVFRYDVSADALSCASCTPTEARPQGGSSLATDGLGLSNDGRLFFNSNDAMAPRDLNKRQDAYEWNGDVPQLISTGTSPFDSSVLGVSANGIDAYFYTYDSLVSQDTNGTLVRIYDARERGGFPFAPPPAPCKASDECHGAGSQPPAPLPMNTITGRSGNEVQRKCSRSKVRRNGRCVKRKSGKKQHHGKRRGSGEAR